MYCYCGIPASTEIKASVIMIQYCTVGECKEKEPDYTGADQLPGTPRSLEYSKTKAIQHVIRGGSSVVLVNHVPQV